MLQLKILHAARKTEDPTCHNQDPAGPSENIHKYLKSTTEVVITAQCIECLLSNTSLKAFPIDIPYIVKSCHIHPKIQMLQWLPIYRRGNWGTACQPSDHLVPSLWGQEGSSLWGTSCHTVQLEDSRVYEQHLSTSGRAVERVKNTSWSGLWKRTLDSLAHNIHMSHSYLVIFL